jgi:hypothetical protein
MRVPAANLFKWRGKVGRTHYRMEKRFWKERRGIRIVIGPLLIGVSGLIKSFIASITEFCISRICRQVNGQWSGYRSK